MSEIKSLADQLRNRLNSGADKKTEAPRKKQKQAEIPKVIDEIRAIDISANKTLAHARVDRSTAHILHHLKKAAGIEASRLIYFAIRRLLEQHPEIKAMVKQYLEQIEL